METKKSGIVFEIRFNKKEIGELTARMNLRRALLCMRDRLNYYTAYLDDSIWTGVSYFKNSGTYTISVMIDDEYQAEERKKKTTQLY